MATNLRSCAAALLAASSLGVGVAWAQDTGASGRQTSGASAAPSAPPKTAFESATEKLKKVEGMWTLYHKDQQLLAEIGSGDLDKNFIILTSIARGISRGQVLGGMSWNFGDDVIWSFTKVGEKLHVLRRNVRFRARNGTPEADAVKLAYSDSVLYALPIIATSPRGGNLVDLTRIFMSDDQQIGRSINMSFASDRSTFAKVKAFSKNVELEVAAVYASGADFDTVADARGAQVNVHYSISRLPSDGYRPRVADDRVGYFLTVLKDFSDKNDDEHFVRYINRWNLQKKDPSAKVSPPKEPIVFNMEKTIPVNLRPIISAGILEWNKAFEKLGFYNAIEVVQQRDDADWDPEDINYNTFRWITANAGFAMGPSRVNPLTGQILDADIIFDSDFLTYWKQQYETFTPADVAALMGNPGDPDLRPFGKLLSQPNSGLAALAGNLADAEVRSIARGTADHAHDACNYCQGMQHQMGFAAAALMARGAIEAPGKGVPDELVYQGLKEVVMHEVGHTLGLRHNFKASSWKTLAEIDDPVKGAAEGTVGSVMDYNPVNIVAQGQKQGLYYPQTIGPYDFWAIEYGYKVVEGDEGKELKKIASRSAEAGLDYATDEDTRGTIDADPLSNRFDLGKDPLEFAKRQTKTSAELWSKVVERAVSEGDSYQRARQAFGILFGEYWRTLAFVSRYPGGIYSSRDHKGDPNGRPPFKPVEAAKQREAMKLLTESAFQIPALPPPEVLNSLAVTRFSHWGQREPNRTDYPLHDVITLMQGNILLQLLAPTTLARMHDSELKQGADADAYTVAEHLRLLVESVFSEWRDAPKAGDYTNRKPYVSSVRRELQRMTIRELATLQDFSPIPVGLRVRLNRLGITPPTTVPDDARTLVRMHLVELDKRITALLAAEDVKLDEYSKAHLVDSQDRIRKQLQSQVLLPTVD